MGARSWRSSRQRWAPELFLAAEVRTWPPEFGTRAGHSIVHATLIADNPRVDYDEPVAVDAAHVARYERTSNIVCCSIPDSLFDRRPSPAIGRATLGRLNADANGTMLSVLQTLHRNELFTSIFCLGKTESSAWTRRSPIARRLCMVEGRHGETSIQRKVSMLAHAQTRSILTSAIALAISTVLAHAGPCSHAIGRAQVQVDAKLAASSNPGRFAPESIAALLHHQPTVASVTTAEGQLNRNAGGGIALAALALARQADHDGNSIVCGQALAAVRQAIGRSQR
jgi:hypothetical protein